MALRCVTNFVEVLSIIALVSIVSARAYSWREGWKLLRKPVSWNDLGGATKDDLGGVTKDGADGIDVAIREPPENLHIMPQYLGGLLPGFSSLWKKQFNLLSRVRAQKAASRIASPYDTNGFAADTARHVVTASPQVLVNFKKDEVENEDIGGSKSLARLTSLGTKLTRDNVDSSSGRRKNRFVWI